jgi:hypothetical protein
MSHPRRRRALALALLLVPLAACLFGRRPDEPRTPLPAGWDTLEPFAFEQLLADFFAPARPGQPAPTIYYDRAAFGALTDALERMDAISVRAALLLAHSRHEKSGNRLMRRLGQREVGPERGSDAGDIVAAAALADFPGAAELYLEDLHKLAVGRRAHPDLEVRVECAAAALLLGDDAPVPFLLQVLRIDTFAGQSDARDFESGEHTAWARGRAAAALSRRAGVPVDYQPDGSILSREREAARLERLLRSDKP